MAKNRSNLVVMVVVIALAAFGTVWLLKDQPWKGRVNPVTGEAVIDTTQPPGIDAKKVTSQKGPVDAIDKTGKGVKAEEIKADGAIRLENSAPPK